MLEVEIATLFSPDQLLELEKMDQNCTDCSTTLEEMEKDIDVKCLKPELVKLEASEHVSQDFLDTETNHSDMVCENEDESINAMENENGD